MQKGKLLLIPTFLAEDRSSSSLVPALKQTISSLGHYIVENEKSARKFLREAEVKVPQNELHILEYGKHHKEEMNVYFKAMESGQDTGLLSEAGCPAIADPGAEIVMEAHRRMIQVVPFVGASSIIMGLMASGFNGQSFCFQGYLPVDKAEKRNRIKQLEKESFRLNQTQIFIETPFRNRQMLDDLVQNLLPETELCIAAGITSSQEYIKTQRISEWKKSLPDLNKVPAVFLIFKRK